MKLFFNLDNIQKRIVFYILIITIPLFLLSLYFVQDYVGSQLRKSAEKKAYSLNLKTLRSVESFLRENSEFTKEIAYTLKLEPSKYKMILPFLKQNLQKNKNLYGSALAIEPNSYLNRKYCKYFYKTGNTIIEKWLMPPTYNYLQKKWYTKVKTTKKESWSEPYFDKGGGNVYMSTFSFPFCDINNVFLGVITADIKLDVLSHKIQNIASLDDGYLYLVSKGGIILSQPSKEPLKKEFLHLFQASKESIYRVESQAQTYLFYTIPVLKTSWVIGVMLKESVLYASLQQLKIRLFIIASIGVILILLMIMVISEQLKKDVAQKEKVKSELELAMKIQKSFLPETNYIKSQNFYIDSFFQSAKEVGGDFYGYRKYKNELLFYLGDVSGKGVPASLFMMATHILIESIIDTITDPALIMQKTNKQLCRASKRGMFTTLIIGKYDFEKESLSFCIAGHPPFIIKSEEKLFSPLVKLFAPVSVFEDIEYENSFLDLKMPFEMMIYSDGITEAQNVSKELFGVEKVSEILSCMFNTEKLVSAVEAFSKGNEQSDDITLLHISFFKSN